MSQHADGQPGARRLEVHFHKTEKAAVRRQPVGRDEATVVRHRMEVPIPAAGQILDRSSFPHNRVERLVEISLR